MRHMSFFTDWRTGLAVPSPQTARMVQVLVKPFTGFRNALMADKWINLNDQNVLVDSYDSSKGIYSSTSNHGNQGNIATNGQLINANNATVDGGAATNDGSVQGSCERHRPAKQQFLPGVHALHERDAQPRVEFHA